MSKKIVIPALILGVMSVSACSLMKNEEQSFIDAKIEATCALAEMDFTDNSTENSDTIRDIYAKHGFDTKDESILLDQLAKYETDPEIMAQVDAGTASCRQKMIDKIMNTQSTPVEKEIESPIGTGEVSDVE